MPVSRATGPPRPAASEPQTLTAALWNAPPRSMDELRSTGSFGPGVEPVPETVQGEIEDGYALHGAVT